MYLHVILLHIYLFSADLPSVWGEVCSLKKEPVDTDEIVKAISEQISGSFQTVEDWVK
jgi:hypothetical protein